MNTTTRQSLIAQYADGCQVVSDALSMATERELDARPAPGKWSAREIIHHLADSEMIAAVRLRRLLAEAPPTTRPADWKLYGGRRHYDRPILGSLEAFCAARRATTVLLEGLSEAEWRRSDPRETPSGYTPEKWLAIYAPHAHTHAMQIRRARISWSRQTVPLGPSELLGVPA
jgi:hypothetical protein